MEPKIDRGLAAVRARNKELANMAGKNTAAFAIFRSRADAESAVDRLAAAGFSHQDISVMMPDAQSSHEFAHEKNTKTPEGTTTGVLSGGAIGGTLGLLAGIGTLAIPGLGPFIAAGPIMGALAGMGAGGAVGGVVGALIGMGIPEYEAKRYEGHMKDGGILVSVHCESSEEVGRAKDVLKACGGDDVASAGEKAISSHGATDEVHAHVGSAKSRMDDMRDDVRSGVDRLEDRLDPNNPTRRY
jgi:hypothetical protein